MNRLEEIKRKRGYFAVYCELCEESQTNLGIEDIKWLIKQAERVEKLERRLGDAHENIEIFKNNFHEYRLKARRYEKALDKIAYEPCEGEWSELSVHYENVATKALEGVHHDS